MSKAYLDRYQPPGNDFNNSELGEYLHGEDYNPDAELGPEWEEDALYAEGDSLFDGEGLNPEEGPLENSVPLTEKQQRLLDRVAKTNRELNDDYQEAQQNYEALINGESDLSLEEREEKLNAILEELNKIDDDVDTMDRNIQKLKKDGIDVEAALLGDGSGEDELISELENMSNEETSENEINLDIGEEVEIMKNDLQEEADQIHAQVEAFEKAQAEAEKKQKEERAELAADIEDAKLYTTWDGGTGGDYNSNPDKDRVYWSGNASNNDHSIWDYYKTDQEWTHKTFDAMAQAARSGNWDSFIGFFKSIPDDNVDNVGTIMYAVFTNEKEGLLEKLPSEVLLALTEETARGNIGSKQDVYVLDAHGGTKTGVKGNGEVRRGNSHVGYGPATAVEGYGALALARQKQEASATESPEEDYYPE